MSTDREEREKRIRKQKKMLRMLLGNDGQGEGRYLKTELLALRMYWLNRKRDSDERRKYKKKYKRFLVSMNETKESRRRILHALKRKLLKRQKLNLGPALGAPAHLVKPSTR